MIRMQISDASLKKAIDEVKNSANKYKTKVSDEITKSALKIESEAKKRAPVDQGQLRASIQAKTGGLAKAEVAVNSKYAPYVEFGTKERADIPSELTQYASQFKGTGTGGFDKLVRKIERWASKKNIDPRAVYPIALSIAKKGIGAQPFLFPAYFQERPRLIEKLKSLKL